MDTTMQMLGTAVGSAFAAFMAAQGEAPTQAPTAATPPAEVPTATAPATAPQTKSADKPAKQTKSARKPKSEVHTHTSARRLLGISKADYKDDVNGAKAKVRALLGKPRTEGAAPAATPKPKASKKAPAVVDGEGNAVTVKGKAPKRGTKRTPYTGKAGKATAAAQANKRNVPVYYVDEATGKTVKHLPMGKKSAAHKA